MRSLHDVARAVFRYPCVVLLPKPRCMLQPAGTLESSLDGTTAGDISLFLCTHRVSWAFSIFVCSWGCIACWACSVYEGMYRLLFVTRGRIVVFACVAVEGNFLAGYRVCIIYFLFPRPVRDKNHSEGGRFYLSL